MRDQFAKTNATEKMNVFGVQTVLIIILAGAVAALTIFVRVPTPATGGYVNLGDVAVIFCGLFLGGRWGLLAGGLGSALADLISGAFIFIPITFVAKGLEAFIAGSLGRKHAAWLLLAMVAMFSTYFIAEIFLPGVGVSAALSSLPFNIIQGTIGAVGGLGIYYGVKKALPSYAKFNS